MTWQIGASIFGSIVMLLIYLFNNKSLRNKLLSERELMKVENDLLSGKLVGKFKEAVTDVAAVAEKQKFTCENIQIVHNKKFAGINKSFRAFSRDILKKQDQHQKIIEGILRTETGPGEFEGVYASMASGLKNGKLKTVLRHGTSEVKTLFAEIKDIGVDNIILENLIDMVMMRSTNGKDKVKPLRPDITKNWKYVHEVHARWLCDEFVVIYDKNRPEYEHNHRLEATITALKGFLQRALASMMAAWGDK
jgi:hypothetical protein